MKNILVTGAYGQLGNEVRILSANYPEYNFMFTDVDSLDITDKDELIDFVTGNDIRYIINCAAYTAVDKA
jgi:dTDP-4-dehydrorhamnose reductase